MRVAEARGFDIFGFKSTRRGQVAQMRPGDKLIFYLTKIMKLGGVATVTSEYFEDHTKVFKSDNRPQEDYPYRVNVRSEITLAPDQYLDVEEIAPRMRYTKKWPPEHWRLAFQGSLRQIPQEDYDLILAEMKQAAAVRPG